MKLRTITHVMIALVVAGLLSGCMSRERQDAEAREALEVNGFTEIAITGWKWTGCGEDDSYSRGFEAVGVNGSRVSGVVCGDYGKGWTVRILNSERGLAARRDRAKTNLPPVL